MSRRFFAFLLMLCLLTAWTTGFTESERDTAAETPSQETIPSLKELYAGKFDFGAAAPQRAFNEAKLREMMAYQFSILTPENELKPSAVLDVSESRKKVQETGDETAVAVRFSSAKALLRFAQQNGIKVHGHVLVWHEQTPEAFFHEGYNTRNPLLSREMMLGRLESYIREVLTQTEELYPGVIVSWDVVNEAIDDSTGWLRKKSNWYKVIGDDFVLRAFEYARKYAADGVLLYYNDYNTPLPGKLKGITKLLEQLVAEGNIDGYGFQMHYSTGNMDAVNPSSANISVALKQISGMGLKLRVSELDIGIPKRNEANLARQKEAYKLIMELMLKYADQTEAVEVWGLRDDMSWKSDKYPLLFDIKGNPKPAFYGVVEAANAEQ